MSGDAPAPSPRHRFLVVVGALLLACPAAGPSLVLVDGGRFPVVTCGGCGAWGVVTSTWLRQAPDRACSSCWVVGCLEHPAVGAGEGAA